VSGYGTDNCDLIPGKSGDLFFHYIQCQGKECGELYLHFTNTTSWLKYSSNLVHHRQFISSNSIHPEQIYFKQLQSKKYTLWQLSSRGT